MILTGTNVPITQLTSVSALRLLRNLLTLPYLAYVPIHPESFNTRRVSEVSTQLIISQSAGGKEFVTDNSAPGPRIWTLKGYIIGIPYIELTNWFMPSLLVQKLVIDNAHTSRKAVPFRTTDGEILSVLIKECNFIEEPDNMNTLKIELVLQELNLLTVTTSLNAVSSTEKGLQKSLPLVGKSLGKVFALGAAAAGYVLATTTVLLQKDEELDKEEITDADPDIPSGDAELLASVTSTLSTEQLARLKYLTIVSFPATPDLVENFSFSAEVQGITIYFTFVFFDSEWKVTTSNDTTSEVVSSRLTPNILLNPLASDFSLYFVSDKSEIGLSDINLIQLVVASW